jgi:uncharacterized membrane protein YfhO
VVFFSYPIITKTEDDQATFDGFHIGGKTKYWIDSYLNKVEAESNRSSLLKGLLNKSTSDIPFLLLAPDANVESNSFEPNDLNAVVITSSQFADLLGSYQTNLANRFRTYLGITAANGTDDKGAPYVQMDLLLRDFRLVDESLSSERYEVTAVPTNIKLFSHGHI